MNDTALELCVGPFRLLRRSLIGWAIGLGSLVGVTVAFWPAFRGSSGISDAIDQLPPGVVQALGLAGFGTPGGYLRGNLYELIVPLLLAIGAVATANGLTAADEEAGRMELHLSQPVTRRAVLLGRTLAMAGWLAVVSALVLIVQLVSDAVFGLDIDATLVVSTVALSAALGLLLAAWRWPWLDGCPGHRSCSGSGSRLLSWHTWAPPCRRWTTASRRSAGCPRGTGPWAATRSSTPPTRGDTWCSWDPRSS